MPPVPSLQFAVALLLLLVARSALRPTRESSTRYDEDKIYVHIVPHTHDDVGWLKTVDEYYTGANRSISEYTVKYILDTVIEQLQKDEKRTFIYVEIAFFMRWWRQQSDDTKNIVRKLISNKQFEFINGGWCMNDEAATHYNAIIDQMTLGLQFIENTFGAEAKPRIAWQIDPFGHSNTQAALFAAMGFDGLFFGRHDYADHILRMNESRLQMVWQPSESLGASADLFTGIFVNHYTQPHGFCYDTRCKCVDDFIQDDPNLSGYNVDRVTDSFIKDIYANFNISATNHIMYTFGGDFEYIDARANFDNMDKLIKYTNQKNSSVELFYSTPSIYLDALHASNKTWTVKQDDFFPYASDPYNYWTGYFTSRPALKGYVREMNNLLQVCTQIEALGLGTAKKISDHTSMSLMQAMGVAQHHDAVSGTEKQHVAYDYAKRLSEGAAECSALIADVLAAHLVTKEGTEKRTDSVPAIETCSLLNVSICPATETNNFNVILYNPLGRPAYYAVKLPLTTNQVSVYDNKGESVLAQISAVSEAVSRVRAKRGAAKYELYFNVGLPPLGYKTYFVRKDNASTAKFSVAETVKLSKTQDDIVIKSVNYDVGISGETGRLYYINNNDDDDGNTLSLKLDQNFMWYNSSDGHNKNSSQASGAYIFRPNGTAPLNLNGSDSTVTVNVVKGPLYEEVQQTFANWVQQSIRIHKDYPFVEFDYIVGPIPINDHQGKEIITRFTSTAETNKTWYTDANGREMQKRVRNYRPTWKLNVTEPVAGNYYPVNSRIFMRYEDTEQGPSQLTVMTDRSQGGASLNDGQLELMVHRRTLHDDKKGVGEPINEPGLDGHGLIIRGSHYLTLSSVNNATATHRLIGEALMLKPYLAFIRDTFPPKTWMNKYQTDYTGLKMSLPLNVHLLTVWLMDEGNYQTLLVRLEHQFEAEETPPYSQAATVSLTDLFSFEIDSVSELALAANTAAPLSRLQWKTLNDAGPRRKISTEPVTGPKYNVVLEPMQIRTFTVKIH